MLLGESGFCSRARGYFLALWSLPSVFFFLASFSLVVVPVSGIRLRLNDVRPGEGHRPIPCLPHTTPTPKEQNASQIPCKSVLAAFGVLAPPSIALLFPFFGR